MKRVVGLDLSLTDTGMAYVEWGRLVEIDNAKSKGKKGMTYAESQARIEKLAGEILCFIARPILPDLVVIESPSYGSRFGSQHERAGLWWEVYKQATKLGIPIATVAPTTRAKYITGDGRTKDKEVVLAFAIQQYVFEDTPRIVNDNEADAAGLAAMGARFLGEPIERHSLSQKQLDAMEGAKWPATT